ncbi:MAG TPA: Gfo/Idh/MocA family oxidoreductase [Gemmatimonadales bacterium]|jgi:predicted dehydrogenase|nr:Gfo/Idh/MocA family oxidoreductase [Gemmatimonadales bacterium]
MTDPSRLIPPDRPVRLVFLGSGNIARRHARVLAGFRQEVRCYFASRDAAKAALFKRELNGVGAFGSYEAALADPAIDVAMVTTPTAQHLELALAALRAGKHVIVEKPPFLHSADFDAVEAAQAEHGGRVFIAENYYYRPLTRTLRRLISDGAIGDVRYLIVKSLKEQRTGGWRDDVALAGGGALFEGGIHWVNLMAGIGLNAKDVRGYRPGRNERGPERSMLAVFRYAEGAVGTLFHSWDTPSLLKGLRLSRIYGSQGSIAFESNGLWVAVFGRRPRLIFPGFRDIGGFNAMFADILACLRSGRAAQLTLARARRDLEFVEAAYRTAADPDRETPA